MDTELIPKHNNLIGYSLPYPYYYGRFPGGSTAVFPLKIAPKRNTKICCPSTPAVTADWADFLMIGANMPRMSKRGSWSCPSSSMSAGGWRTTAFAGNAATPVNRASGRSSSTAPSIFPNEPRERRTPEWKSNF